MNTRELHMRVMSMTETDCRNELCETLEMIDKLETDFAVLVRHVVHTSDEAGIALIDLDLGGVIQRRGIDIDT